MTTDPLAGLTEAQGAAVRHLDGPMLVLAGPGSGKTRVITHRIAHLISKGVPPNRILALTFTNKAAGEMRDRLRTMAAPPGVTICTFHALCARLLHEFAGRAGLPEGFTIYGQSDQRSVIGEILRDKHEDPRDHFPGQVLRRIGDWKNALLAPEQVPVEPGKELYVEIYAAYQKRLAACGALDFDDLLMATARLVRDDGELREKLGRRYRYILVDEYQDTNACQYRIARDLSRDHGNLFVTGDPDQSIYGWRGADVGIILAFETDFPKAPILRLEDNFRSTPQVLRLADEMIRANRRRKEKRLIPRRPDGNRPSLYRYDDELEEARGAAAWARFMHDEHGVDYRRMAIFYRINAMSRVLEEALLQAAIPYQIVKGLEFFERREIKDMLAYLRVLVNPADDAALLRVINRPARGLGQTTVQRLMQRARELGCDLWTVLRDPFDAPDVSPPAASRIGPFVALIEELRSKLDRPAAAVMADVYDRSGLRAALEQEKNADAAENVEELIQSARLFDLDEPAGGTAGYLRHAALISDADAYDDESGAVSLMTLHTAKGLEFAAVLIVGLEDGILPHSRSREGGRDFEEERRLLFVGITRAERFLALSHARSRALHGMPRRSSLSPFIEGLAELEVVPAPFLRGVFERPRGAAGPSGPATRYPGGRAGTGGGAPGGSASGPARRSAPGTAGGAAFGPRPGAASGGAGANAGTGGPGGSRPQGLGSDSSPRGGAADDTIRTGRRVRHPALGEGRIEGFSADGSGNRVIVQFDRGARLLLDLRLAKLELID